MKNKLTTTLLAASSQLAELRCTEGPDDLGPLSSTRVRLRRVHTLVDKSPPRLAAFRNPIDLDRTAGQLVDRLAAGPTVAIGLAKQAIHYAQHATLTQAMAQETLNLELSCRTADFKEGLAAFTQRRTPEFGGR